MRQRARPRQNERADPELVLKEILPVWHLAVESQEALLVWTQRLTSHEVDQQGFKLKGPGRAHVEVNLLLLVRIHVSGGVLVERR
jgi:hypothetical protein